MIKLSDKQKYFRNTIIQAVVIGTVLWLWEITVHRHDDPASWWWCSLMMMVAIVGTDYIKGQKIFDKNQQQSSCQQSSCQHEEYDQDKQIKILRCRKCGHNSWLRDIIDLFPSNAKHK